MSLQEQEEDILQIDINCDDLILEEELTEPSEPSEFMESPQSNEFGCSNSSVLLKIIRKGKLPVDKYREKILKYYNDSVKLNVTGFFFNDSSSALVEVQIDNSLKSYLIRIYEDRLGRKLLNQKSVDNIINICDGKFPLLIENSLLFLVIIPNVKFVNLSCKSSHALYGFHNGNIYNLLLGKFKISDRITMHEIYTALQNIFSSKFNVIFGLKFQSCADSSSYCARIIINNDGFSGRILSDLNKTFGMPRFSSETVHAFLVKDATEIQNKFSSSSASESVTLLSKIDLISAELNDFSKAKRIKISKKVSPDEATSKNAAHSSGATSIFSRLGGKISEFEPTLD
ncbi:hypothetical protein ACKWTF_013041 [Chironomus riparius]